jgi:glutamate-ammonia-ligase adenylyltransferase
MRGVYVHRVEIASVGREARDRLLIATRDGRKIEDAAQLATLRAAVAVLKRFTAPAAARRRIPAAALRAFSQLVDRVLASASPDQALPLLASPRGCGSSRACSARARSCGRTSCGARPSTCCRCSTAGGSARCAGGASSARELEARLAAAASFEDERRLLNAFKDEEMLLADMRHLLDPQVDLVAFSAAITDLAEAVVASALRACLDEVARTHGWPRDESGRRPPVAILGLGKFGGREMGYASDIELVVVYGFAGRTEKSGVDAGVFFEAVVREITGLIAAREEGIFHVDLRLRPHGAKGPLATPLATLRDYYRAGGGAAPFERQALIKLRRVAGDEALGAEVERVRDAFVWSDGALEPRGRAAPARAAGAGARPARPLQRQVQPGCSGRRRVCGAVPAARARAKPSPSCARPSTLEALGPAPGPRA